MIKRESDLYRPHLSTLSQQEMDKLIGKILKFSVGTPMKYIVNCEEKLRLAAHSVPAYEILSLPTQIAFKVWLC